MSYYDEIEIEDFFLENGVYYFPCPCGDLFFISASDIEKGHDIASCPSCSLVIKVII